MYYTDLVLILSLLMPIFMINSVHRELFQDAQLSYCTNSD